MSDPRSGTERAETLGSGITWKRFVLDLPVDTQRRDAREFVPILDDPGAVLLANAFEFVTKSGRVSPSDAREFGRALAVSATPADAAAYLDAFARMGMGHLDLATQGNGRYRFTSQDLHLAAGQSRVPSCTLVLGFCEGIIERLTGRTALGSEVACRSMGHENCTFQVSVRN